MAKSTVWCIPDGDYRDEMIIREMGEVTGQEETEGKYRGERTQCKEDNELAVLDLSENHSPKHMPICR